MFLDQVQFLEAGLSAKLSRPWNPTSIAQTFLDMNLFPFRKYNISVDDFMSLKLFIICQTPLTFCRMMLNAIRK
jgi:hypothetical protein